MNIRILFSILALAGSLCGQSNLGNILGRVQDATRSPVAKAKVTAVNLQTGATRTFETTVAGEYEFSYLLPGSYRIDVEAPGFSRFSEAGVVLDAARRVRVDASLAVGSLSESVTVSGQSVPLIETDTAALNDSRGERLYRSLPIAQGQEPFNLLANMPNFQSANTKYRFTIGGARTGQSEFQQDGVSAPNNNNPELSASMTMEGVREVKLMAFNNSAEFGLPGIYQTITKSGGNDFHGSAFYFHQNAAFNARNFFDVTRPPQIGHTFGGSFSGPVMLPKIYNGKNKTFFMIAYDAAISPGATTRVDSVPSAGLRTGNFAGIANIRDPYNGNAPFPGNQIPANRLSPLSLAVQNRYFPAANFGPATDIRNNFRVQLSTPGKSNIGDARIDQRFGDRNNFYIRVGARQFPATRVRTLPTVGSPSILRTFRNVILSDTHTFSSRLINEFRFGYHGTDSKYIDGGQRGLDVIKAIGLQGIDNVPDDWGMPQFVITGFSAIQHNGNNRYRDQNRSTQFSNSTTFISGRHTIKAGIDTRYLNPTIENVPLGLYGRFDFQGNFGSHPYADFLLGVPTQSIRVPPAPIITRLQRDWFGFVQDDFRVNARLTVNYGLRYEYQRPLTNDLGFQYNFDPATGKVVVPTDRRDKVNRLFNPLVPIVTAREAGYPEGSFRRADTNNFAPRIGFALRLSNRNDFVVRGGYGYFIVNVGNSLTSPYEGGPFQGVNAQFVNALVNGAPQLAFPNPFPSSGAAASTAPPGLSGVNPSLKNPYTQQWNLTLERSVLSMGLRMSYLATKSTQIFYRRNINVPPPSTTPLTQARRPYPIYNNISYMDNGGSGQYHALQMEANRRFKNGLSYMAAWTWASNVSDVNDDGGGVFGASIENPFDRRRERAREVYAIRHRFVSNFIWELPFGRGRQMLKGVGPLANQLIGGWEMVGAVSLQTGNWFTPNFVGSDPSNTQTIGGRPDRIGDGNLPAGQRTVERWFDRTAFAVPPSGRFGNSGRNVLEGPGVQVFHLSLGKDFTMTESLKANFQVAAQNLFNHPNFELPNATVNNLSGGLIGASTDRLEQTGARSLILRLRLIF